VITQVYTGMEMGTLRKTVDLVREKSKNAVIALGADNQGRALLVLGLTENLCQKGLDASQIIAQIASAIGGSGGGRKDFAQAGGAHPENLNQAFQTLKNIIQQRIS
jgi:alanyl-tRNA synthetase